jgi:multimeric flavodoxin WrbA
MNIVGILGTENRIGATMQMLEAVLEGTHECGCRTNTIYLDDYWCGIFHLELP